MKKITYYCDLCDTELIKDDKGNELKISVSSTLHNTASSFTIQIVNFEDICNKCMSKVINKIKTLKQ